MTDATNAVTDGGDATSMGKEAIRKLKSTGPPLYLSPSPELSESARLASDYLFSALKPYTPKSPFTQLLVNGFDAEQIWQQIDLQSQPLISSLRRRVRNFEKNPEEVENWINNLRREKIGTEVSAKEKTEDLGVEEDSEDSEDEEIIGLRDGNSDHDDDDNEDGEEEEEEEEEKEKDGAGGVEDKFLKINELEEYLEEDEAREYGLKREKKKGKKGSVEEEGEEEEGEGGEDEDDEDEDDGDETGDMGLDYDGNDGAEGGSEDARYEDFFGVSGKNAKKRKAKSISVSDNSEMDEESFDDDKNQKLSTHERELEKLRSTIEQMEKANLEPKTWTMQGEVTAAKRPKNSALEVDLDFEHNVRPAPVITEEVTASLEELIQQRIIEGRFDDVQKPLTLPSRTPREAKELDENKSKKGLAEIYEEEYAQKTGLVSVSVSISDQQKKEATALFKELCLKLDALSHFHFTPKPVIEDMAIQANVPALAMEEIAPLAVSDAAMLAPEEVFAGKGDIKEETELTQAERKRRRANKKRKFKAMTAKRTAKAPQTPLTNSVDGNEP